MNHKTLDAKATVLTDAGEFTAIAAAYTLDRGGDRIVPGAFGKTIEKWQASGKQIPLHWDHSGSAADIIGTVDPATMEETELGLKVAGKVDLEGSEVAREAWRSMKSGAMALSFGYMVVEGAEAKDAYELLEIDLFEVSVTPAPMNPDTRFLSLKSVKDMSRDELREELTTLRKRLDEVEASLEEQPPKAADKDESEQAPEESRQASDPEAVKYELERLHALS